MIKPSRHYIFLMVLLIMFIQISQADGQQQVSPQPSPQRIIQDINYLASDKMEGRLAGSLGAQNAANYIMEGFRSAGLLPGDKFENDYFQEFSITSSVRPGENNHLIVNSTLRSTMLNIGEEWTPLFFSSNGEVNSQVIFAGYGITAPEFGWDDYAGIDAKGKIIFCLRNEPRAGDPESPFDGQLPTKYASIQEKASNAKAHGAVALILATGPLQLQNGKDDSLINMDRPGAVEDAGIPVIQILSSAVSLLWEGIDTPIEFYQSEMDRHMKPRSINLDNISVSLKVNLIRNTATTANVVGILPGNDSQLSDGWLVVGAHYDHLGWGIDQSSYQGKEPMIHNGADDNASGVAGLLELARMFSVSSRKPSRSILFIAFSAEELGLLGSKKYIETPLVPLENTIAYINMDMIGRVKPDDQGNPAFWIYGINTAKEWNSLIPTETPDGLVKIIQIQDQLSGGDYLPFYNAGIPNLNITSGSHEDFHKPGDDTDLINEEGEASLLGALFEIILNTANLHEPLTFQKRSDKPRPEGIDSETSQKRSAYLGTIPDFSKSEGGFFIAGVIEGSPAEAAGLQAGDQIIKVGEYTISNIYDYTNALNNLNPGDLVVIEILRDEVQITISLIAGARSN